MNAIRTIEKILSKILTKWLRFICLFVNVNEMAGTYEDLQSSKSSTNRPKATLQRELIKVKHLSGINEIHQLLKLSLNIRIH